MTLMIVTLFALDVILAVAVLVLLAEVKTLTTRVDDCVRKYEQQHEGRF